MGPKSLAKRSGRWGRGAAARTFRTASGSGPAPRTRRQRLHTPPTRLCASTLVTADTKAARGAFFSSASLSEESEGGGTGPGALGARLSEEVSRLVALILLLIVASSRSTSREDRVA